MIINYATFLFRLRECAGVVELEYEFFEMLICVNIKETPTVTRFLLIN